jgi:HK97 family phage prohead protease
MARQILERNKWGEHIKADRPKRASDAPALRKHFATKVEKGVVNPDTGMQQFVFVASTEAVDREGDILFADGWEVENYMLNPVILWGHNYSSKPIGRAVALEVKDSRLYVTVDFTPKEINPEGYQIYLMVQAGYVSAVSVGFQPKKWVWNDEHNGYDFEANELLEISVVPVPANQEALLAAGLDESFAKQFSDMSKEAAASILLKDIISMAMSHNSTTQLKDTALGGETHKETAPEAMFLSCSSNDDSGSSVIITDSGGKTWTGTVYGDSDYTVPIDVQYREWVLPEGFTWPPPEQKGMDEMEITELTEAVKELTEAVKAQNEKLASLPDELAQRLAPEPETKIEEPEDTKEPDADAPEAEAEGAVEPEGDESEDDVIEVEGLTEDGLREMLIDVVKDARTATTGRLPD